MNSYQLDPIAGDPLLPVDEVARWLGVSPLTITSYVLEGGMKSLDEGVMIAAGDRSTPLIRSREVRRFMKDLFDRLSDVPRPTISDNLIENTPVLVAYAFVMGLPEKNHERIWEASSHASKHAFVDPEALFKWWYEYLDVANATEPGVASGVYTIGEQAVSVMYLPDTPPSGGIMQGPAIVSGNPLALVEELDGWRIDQPLQARFQEWRHLVTIPPQAQESGGDLNGPDSDVGASPNI